MNQTPLSNFRNLAHSLSVTVLAMATVAAFTTACSGNSSSAPGPELAGTSSGGGSFGDESSMKLLNWSKGFTAASIRRANPAVFANLPKGWTQERLAKLIESTKAEPRTEANRYNRELMFDYRTPKAGEPYLVATALFFRAHAAVPVNSSYQQDLEPYFREIRTKLLHEAAHVIGIGLSETSDIKARIFAFYVATEILARNNILCEAANTPINYPGNIENAQVTEASSKPADSSMAVVKSANYLWAFNRPTGFGLQSLKSPRMEDEGLLPWLKQLRDGTPIYHPSFSLFAQAPDRTAAVEYMRWYTSPVQVLWAKDRLSAQYYKTYGTLGTPISKALLGASSSYYIQDASGVKTLECDESETFEIPISYVGRFESTITYRDSCGLRNPGESRNQDTKEVRFKVTCRESYDVLEHIDEFFGENLKFSNQRLNEYLRQNGEID